jgi:YD repeat-containing protein
MTERDRWGLRGPVHACRLQRTWYSRRCGPDECETEERSDITALEFRADGSFAGRWHHNPDGSEETATYEYNEAGRLTSVRTENGAGLVDLQFCDYDTACRLVRKVIRAAIWSSAD